MDKYTGFDIDGKKTEGGNRQIRDRQNRFHLSPLPKFLDLSHQPTRSAPARAWRFPKDSPIFIRRRLQLNYNYTTPYLPIFENYPSHKCFN